MHALLALLLAACGDDAPTSRVVAERVVSGDALRGCPGGGEPVRVDVPPGAMVQAWHCDDDGERCLPVGHVLVNGARVEVSCATSTGRLRRVRWLAPAE